MYQDNRIKSEDLPNQNMVFEKTTQGITVSVEPVFLDNQSNPSQSHFVWAYHVIIRNDSARAVRLRSRYWHITDARGQIEEVEGDGVVGEQPLIETGDTYEYTSGTPLTTSCGLMRGAYVMEIENGETFEVDIPLFSLDSPYQNHVIH